MAPEAVNVELLPLHSNVGLPEAIMVGLGLTVMAIVLVPIQFPFCPDTV